MAELTSTLNQLLSGQTPQISQRIGADDAQTSDAVQMAVPSLLAALSQEANRGGGLQQALAEDHDGSIVDNLAGYLNGSAQLNPRATDGSGILGHVLGDRQETLARGISARSGLEMGSVMQLLTLLAPVVMGMLSKKQQTPESRGDLNDVLNREREDAQTQGGLGDLIGSVLGGGSTGGLGDVIGSVFGDRK